MSEVTIELVQAKQNELASMIEALQRKQQPTTLRIPAVEIELFPGEWYAGAVLNDDGSVKHHTVVSKESDETRDYDQTQAWAKGLGLSAPTIQEARLIVAHKYGRLADMTWFWTCEPHSNSAYAWYCHLNFGNGDLTRSSLGGGVAVRRVNP